jgi:glutamate synthase domain-containing protein 2
VASRISWTFSDRSSGPSQSGWRAGLRWSIPAGIDQRSPARHPDWLGPDDLSLKVQEIREAPDYQVPIQV